MPKRLLVALSVLFVSSALSAQEMTFSEWGPSIVYQNHLPKAAAEAGDADGEMAVWYLDEVPVTGTPFTSGKESDFPAVRKMFRELSEFLDDHPAFHRGE